MSERKSPATVLAPAALCAVAAVLAPRGSLAQTAPPTPQAAAQPPAESSRRLEPRARRLSNGMTLVSAQSAGAAAVVLAVPAGSARGDQPEASAELVTRQASIERPRCERAGLSSTVVRDRAWAEFVTRAPAASLELALWREASRLDALESSEPSAIRALHRAAFDPSHAVLVVIGPSDSATLDALVDRTVGRIPSRSTPVPTLARDADPPPAWQRTGDGGWARQWSVVGDRTPDHYALELISWVLADGRGALVPGFVASRSVRGAVLVESFVDHELERDRFHLALRYAAPQAQRPPLDTLVDELLSRLAREGVTGVELNRARERWRVAWREGEGSIERLALRWARLEARWGNARLAFTEEDRYDAVTVQDVLRVINQQLVRPATNATQEAAR